MLCEREREFSALPVEAFSGKSLVAIRESSECVVLRVLSALISTGV